MYRTILFSFLVLLSFGGAAQSRFSVNLNGGLDYNINKYYNPNTYKKFENGKTDFNLGLDVGYRLGDNFRFRIELKYAELSYGHYYLSNSDLLKSEMTLSNMNINPRMDWRIWTLGSFDFFLTTGLRLEFGLDAWQESLRTDGAVSTNKYISTDYDDNMSGLIGGGIMKFNLSKHLGITFAPEYTLFFDELFQRNNGVLQRFSTNAGIEWTF